MPPDNVPLFIPGKSPTTVLAALPRILLGRRIAMMADSYAITARFLATRAARDRVAVLEHHVCEHRGLWYSLIDEAFMLLERHLGGRDGRLGTGLPAYYAGRLAADKLEALLKDRILCDILYTLHDLHLLRLNAGRIRTRTVILPRSPVQRLVAGYFQERHAFPLRIVWLGQRDALPLLTGYLLWLAREALRRGFSRQRERTRFAFCREASMGFTRSVLKDDILVDGDRIPSRDILFLTRPLDQHRRKASEECAQRGYTSVDPDRLPFPLGTRLPGLLRFHVWDALIDFIRLLAEDNLHLFRTMVSLRKESLSPELLLCRYEIGTFLSDKDSEETPLTLVANRHGSRTALIETSDIATIRDMHQAFLTHNICMFWGDVFRDYQARAGHQRIDRLESVGCIFKASYRDNVARRDALKEELEIGPERVLCFFDSSFHDSVHHGQAFFLRYLELVLRCCDEFPDLRILLKPKRPRHYDDVVSGPNLDRFETLWSEFERRPNFKYLLGWTRDPEAAFAVSDIVVSMGFISPSTLALLCGVDALVYDETGNTHHPFVSAYPRLVVIQDPETLVSRIREILSDHDRPTRVIPEAELARYDAHRDCGALHRIRDLLSCPPGGNW